MPMFLQRFNRSDIGYMLVFGLWIQAEDMASGGCEASWQRETAHS